MREANSLSRGTKQDEEEERLNLRSKTHELTKDPAPLLAWMEHAQDPQGCAARPPKKIEGVETAKIFA